jgi:predicted nucleotidyltransferase
MMAPADPFIDDAVRQRIMAELDALEHDHGVRILFAVESGSRAWGFPSRDSDYDVRFVYLQPADRYLTVTPRRDVIERPIDDLLDIGGWDLRKALQLLVRSNAVLLEWLTSPVRYRDSGAEPARLLGLARTSADLTALAHHYDHQARRSFAEIEVADDGVRHKTYCYALRSTLALLWLRDRDEPPPMDLPSLLAGLKLSPEVRETVDALVARKAPATEYDTGARLPPLDALITRVLAEPAIRQASVSRAEVVAQADALFASIVLHSFSAKSAGP